MIDFNFPIVFNRWIVFVACIALMSISGTMYAFSAWSAALKLSLDLNPDELNEVSTFANIGGWSGIIGGFFLDAFGARLTALFGSTFLGIGYALVALATSHQVKMRPIAVALAALLYGQGGSWAYSAALKTCAGNFADADRGKVIGALVAFFGLSGGLFTQFQRSFFPKSSQVSEYLSFVAIVALSIGILSTVFLSVVPSAESLGLTRGVPTSFTGSSQHLPLLSIHPWPKYLDNNASPRRIAFLLSTTLLIALYLAVAAFLAVFYAKYSHLQTYLGYGLIVMLCLLLLLPVGAGKVVWWRATTATTSGASFGSSQNAAGGGSGGDGDGGGDAAEDRRRRRQVEAAARRKLAKRKEKAAAKSWHNSSDTNDNAAAPDDDSNDNDVYYEPTSDVLIESGLDAINSAGDLGEGGGDGDGDGVGVGDDASSSSLPSVAPSLSLRQALMRFEFYCLFFTFFSSIGCGIVLVNNASELIISRQAIVAYVDEAQHKVSTNDIDHSAILTLVSLFSIFNTIGRLSMGYLSDRYARFVSRPALLAAVVGGMAGVALAAAFAPIDMLYPLFILLGLVYGSIFILTPALTVDLFGLRYLGACFGALGVAPALGSLLLSSVLAAKLDAYFEKSNFIDVVNGDESTRHCRGVDCLKYSLLVSAFVASLGVASALLLLRTTRASFAYKRLIDEQDKQQNNNNNQ